LAVTGCSIFGNVDGISDGNSLADPSGDGGEVPPPPLTGCGTGRVCAQSVDADWSIVLAGTGPTCPEGYVANTTLVEQPPDTPPAQCSCTCGTVPKSGPCGGSFKLAVSLLDPQCTVPDGTVPSDGTCASIPTNSGNIRFQVSPPPAPPQEACPGTPNRKLGVVQEKSVRLCSLGAGAGGDCPADRQCIAAPPDGEALCVLSTNAAAACPEGYPKRRMVGTSLSDARDCSACTCETRFTCKVTSFVASTNSSCTADNVPIPADGVCRAMTASDAYDHAKGTTTIEQGPCEVKTPSTPTGSLALKDPRVLCCR
jgi:hypothetical protein